MNNQKKTSKEIPPAYRSSWINHFTGWIRRLPGAPWGYYAGLGIFLLLVQAVVLWIEGGELPADIHPVQLFLSGAIPYILAVTDSFNTRAASALQTMKSALKVDEQHYEQLAFKLTTLPALPAIFASLLALACVLGSESLAGEAYMVLSPDTHPISAGIARGIYLACWWCFGIFCHHTIHQFRVINHIYTNDMKIDLYNRKPFYGFSNLTALKAASFILLPLGFLFLNRVEILQDPIVLGIYVVLSVIAILSFLLPQMGVHRMQSEEKTRLLGEASKRYEAAVSQLHNNVDRGNYSDASNLSTAISCLEKEIKGIEKLPTWPWEPETLRWFITAMVLPLLIWVGQYLLGRWLAP